MDITAALQPVHFRNVIEPDTVGVAEDEKHRSFRSFEFIGAEVVRSHSHRFDVINKIGEFVRRRTQRLYSASIGVPLNISHVNFGQKSFASLTQPSRA